MRWPFSSHDDELVNVPRQYASVHHRSMTNVKVAERNSRLTMQRVDVRLKVVLRQLKLPTDSCRSVGRAAFPWCSKPAPATNESQATPP